MAYESVRTCLHARRRKSLGLVRKEAAASLGKKRRPTMRLRRRREQWFGHRPRASWIGGRYPVLPTMGFGTAIGFAELKRST